MSSRATLRVAWDEWEAEEEASRPKRMPEILAGTSLGSVGTLSHLRGRQRRSFRSGTSGAVSARCAPQGNVSVIPRISSWISTTCHQRRSRACARCAACVAPGAVARYVDCARRSGGVRKSSFPIYDEPLSQIWLASGRYRPRPCAECGEKHAVAHFDC